MRKQLVAKKRFSYSTQVSRNGRGSITVFPQNGQVGPATFHTYRYSDQAMPSQGDQWEFGHDLLSNIQGWEWLQRTFVIASGGAGRIIPRLYINSDGLVSVVADGSFYSPSIDTPLLKINGTNISQLYQSKADMANYIRSGTLANYVNASGNQTLTGKKTFTGGINTKSPTVSGATALGNEMLLGVDGYRRWNY